MVASLAASLLGVEFAPKNAVIINTLAVVVVTAIVVRIVVLFTNAPKASLDPTSAVLAAAAAGSAALASAAPPVAQLSGGRVALKTKHFGDPSETRRDVGRAFCAKAIYCQAAGAPTAAPLLPPSGVPPGVDAEALAVQFKALTEALSAQLGVELPPTALQRLWPMLTVNPALEALAALGEMPSVLQHRFIVQARQGAGGAVALHALTLGFVGMPLPGGAPHQKAAPNVLIVDSPDLSAPAPAEDPLAYELRYSVRRAQHKNIDLEMPSALASPPSGLP